MVEPERPQMAIWRCVAFCISKATHAQAHASALGPAPNSTHTHAHARTFTHALWNIRTEICKTLLLHGNNSFVNAPHCYIMSTCCLVVTSCMQSINSAFLYSQFFLFALPFFPVNFFVTLGNQQSTFAPAVWAFYNRIRDVMNFKGVSLHFDNDVIVHLYKNQRHTARCNSSNHYCSSL